jgi:hypothetical protein
MPERRIEEHEQGIRAGGILMGVQPRSDKDASNLVREWQAAESSCIHEHARYPIAPMPTDARILGVVVQLTTTICAALAFERPIHRSHPMKRLALFTRSRCIRPGQ